MERIVHGARMARLSEMRLSAVFFCCVLCLAGCRSAPSRPASAAPDRPPEISAVSPPKASAVPSPAASSAKPFPGRAYLSVTAIEVSAPFVRRNQPFTVKLRISNQGGRAVESFEVQAQANLERSSSVQSFPIGGREKLKLMPGQTAEIALTRSEGLPLVGIYTITADLLLTEWGPVEDTDRVNPKIPQARIVVTD